jgi:L-fuconolactonase
MSSPLSSIEVIDAQVHIAPAGDPHPPTFTIEEMRVAMRDQRIDAALVTARTQFDRDNHYLLEATTRFPDVFGAVGIVSPDLEDLDERLRTWRTQPGMLGVRIAVLNEEQRRNWESGAYRPLFVAAERHQVPLCLWAPGRLNELAGLMRTYPALRLIVDHLGLAQPTGSIRRDEPPFEKLEDLVRLAEFPKVAVKLTGAPTLSLDSFPFADLWPALHRIIDAFGPHRVMWGSDWTRVRTCSYADGVDYIRDTTELSESDKALVLGQTLRRAFDWWPRGFHSGALPADIK